MDAPPITPEKILEVLSTSGFMFELEVASALESTGFHVETAWPFADSETGKSREIDLRATKNLLHDSESKIQVFVELLIECKDSSSPFVFVERQKNKREIAATNCEQYYFPAAPYRKHFDASNSYQEQSGFSFFDLRREHYYFRESMKAVNFTKIVRKGSNWVANHDGVYDSVFLPIAKAVRSRLNSLSKNKSPPKGWQTIWLLFPAVVLREGLYAVSASENGMAAAPRDRVSFVRQLDSDSLKGEFLVDFVKFDALPKFLSEAHEFAGALVDIAKQSPSKLRNEGPV